MKYWYLLWILVPMLAQSAGAADQCPRGFRDFIRNVFLKGEIPQESYVFSEPGKFPEAWKKFLNELPEEDRRWVYANQFYDREMIATSVDRESNQVLKMWDEGFLFPYKPLKNYEKTFEEYILKEKNFSIDDFNFEKIAKFNGELMEQRFWGPQKNSKFGKMREGGVYFNLVPSEAKKYEFALKKNPYFKIGPAQPNGVKKVIYPDASEVPALMENALARLKTAVKNSTSTDQRVRAYTNFAKDLVSIHPFSDGNGRTTRFTLDYLLSKEGLWLPILDDVSDIAVTDERFYERVVQGVKTSRAFSEDLIWRSKAGLDVKKTPYNVVSRLPKDVWFPSKALKGRKSPFPLDAYDYNQFVRQTAGQLTSGKETDLLRKYVDQTKKWSVHFVKNGEITDLYQVKRVPDELMLLNGTSNDFLKSKEGLKSFHSQFYTDEEIYRGLSTRSTLTDEELLAHFKEYKSIHLSMRGGSAGSSQKQIVQDAVSSMKKFNKMVDDPKSFFSDVADHMNAEGSYSKSIFASTSKNRATAKRFAEGFLTDPNSILKMKGQMIISSYRPKYGAVDFNRLNEISTKTAPQPFVSKYPRQEEVAVVGGVNPMSVTKLEFKDVTVEGVTKNTGESIAGQTKVSRTRILERLVDDPSKVKFTTLDEKGQIVSEKIVSIY